MVTLCQVTAVVVVILIINKTQLHSSEIIHSRFTGIDNPGTHRLKK